MTCGIYKITEIETGRCYIGQSKKIEARWKQHHKRFPVDSFEYEILLTCDVDCLNFFERAFIDGYDSHRSGLNKTLGGNSIKSTHPDEETLAKISQNRKGKLHSEETKRKMSETRRGRKHSEEAIENMRIAQRARAAAGGYGEPWNKGKPSPQKGVPRGPCSEETKRKISEAAQRRQPISEETKRKMSDARRAWIAKQKEIKDA